MPKGHSSRSLLALVCASTFLLNGCCTMLVRNVGHYDYSDTPKRAVILRDRRVVVDFERNSIQSRYAAHKRAYYDMAAIKSRDELEDLVPNLTPAHEPGRWKRVSPGARLRPIPELDADGECQYQDITDPSMPPEKRFVAFTICDERNPQGRERRIAVSPSIMNGRTLTGKAAQVLLVPAVVIDIVLLPVYALVFYANRGKSY